MEHNFVCRPTVVKQNVPLMPRDEIGADARSDRAGRVYDGDVDYYGDLVQINEFGRCGGYGYARRGYGGYRYDD